MNAVWPFKASFPQGGTEPLRASYFRLHLCAPGIESVTIATILYLIKRFE